MTSSFKVFAAIVILITFANLARAQLKQYDTKYYTIFTDLSDDDEKEAAIRMTKMADEYHERTKGFSGVIRTKFPFYLFRSKADYLNAGGLRGTTGVFIAIGQGGKLMACASNRQDLWHTVQHEGFHQFAHAVIGGEMPAWLNEGLAEYFGESIFTGNGFVTGIVPPWREGRLKDEITAEAIKPWPTMMHISADQWADEMNIKNYDQAWSMVHFLVHGDDGKHQDAFSKCISEISAGQSFDHAWQNTLGQTDGLEDRWKAWWLAQPESPTRILYAKATIATMTSYVARAWVNDQKFASFTEFKSVVEADQLKISDDDWLPPALIKNTMRQYGLLPSLQITPGLNKQPIVCLTIPDGTRVSGSFTLRGKIVDQVNIDIDDMAKVLSDAQVQVFNGRAEAARAMVIASLKQNPKSPSAADARKFLKALR